MKFNFIVTTIAGSTLAFAASHAFADNGASVTAIAAVTGAAATSMECSPVMGKYFGEKVFGEYLPAALYGAVDKGGNIVVEPGSAQSCILSLRKTDKVCGANLPVYSWNIVAQGRRVIEGKTEFLRFDVSGRISSQFTAHVEGTYCMDENIQTKIALQKVSFQKSSTQDDNNKSFSAVVDSEFRRRVGDLENRIHSDVTVLFNQPGEGGVPFWLKDKVTK